MSCDTSVGWPDVFMMLGIFGGFAVIILALGLTVKWMDS